MWYKLEDPIGKITHHVISGILNKDDTSSKLLIKEPHQEKSIHLNSKKKEFTLNIFNIELKKNFGELWMSHPSNWGFGQVQPPKNYSENSLP